MTIRRRRGLMGAMLMALSMVAALSITSPAAAQDGPSEVSLDVISTALYVSPLNDSVPDTLVEQFPPQVICVLFPEACTEQSEIIRDPLTDVVQEINDSDVTIPAQPVPPDTLVTSYLAGATRYQSAVSFSLPEIPEGEELDSLIVQLSQSQPTYAAASPLYRDIMFNVIALAASQDPAEFGELMAQSLQEEAPIEQPEQGIEACPLLIPMADQAAPQAASDSELIQDVGNGPEIGIDCLYGASGVFEDGVWLFDLTFAAEAWINGAIANNGVLLRPTGVPNLAFGDPDTSFTTQVALDAVGPLSATMATSEPFVPAPVIIPEPQQPPAAPEPGSTSNTISAPPSSGIFTATPPAPSSGSVSAPSAPSAPAVADPADNPAPEPVPVAIEPVSQGVESNPLLWALLPVFLVGAYLTAKSLSAELVVATSHSGALTRLVGR